MTLVAGAISVEDLTPERLTECLRAAAVLPSGRVTAVTLGERRTTILATIAPFRVEYSADAPADAPVRLLLKATHGGLGGDLQKVGEREVVFYRLAAPLTPDGLLARCYGAEFADSRFHLLLEDLSETHTILTTWPLPPSVEACERIVDAWAAFHGFWWRHPRLGRDIGTFLDEAAVATMAGEHRRRYARFAESLGDRLGPSARALYDRVLASLERLYTPARFYANPTLVHGDAHVWNLLYPRPGVDAGIRIIDWDSWRIARGALDLAYMMAVHWYRERRARLETALLDRYHAALCARGVTGYGRARLAEDYRLSVIAQLFTPVWQHSYGLHPSIWWPHLDRILAAAEDLDCAALLA